MVAVASRTSARSYLYVPGDRPDRFDGALRRGADAVILDLEDAVPPAGKSGARSNVGDWLARQERGSAQLWVRINITSADQDLAAVVMPAVAGVVVPKAEPVLLAEVDRLLTARERDICLPHGHTSVLALIETATGVLLAPEVARSPRVSRLGVGEADLLAELRIRPSGSGDELAPIRLQLVLASAAADIGAPVASTSTDFRDLDELRRSTQALMSLGFRARTAIHPAQVAVINEVFSPSAAELDEARQLVAAYEQSQIGGSGVFTDSQGRMVDAAVVRSAREVLMREGTDSADRQLLT